METNCVFLFAMERSVQQIKAASPFVESVLFGGKSLFSAELCFRVKGIKVELKMNSNSNLLASATIHSCPGKKQNKKNSFHFLLLFHFSNSLRILDISC